MGGGDFPQQQIAVPEINIDTGSEHWWVPIIVVIITSIVAIITTRMKNVK